MAPIGYVRSKPIFGPALPPKIQETRDDAAKAGESPEQALETKMRGVQVREEVRKANESGKTPEEFALTLLEKASELASKQDPPKMSNRQKKAAKRLAKKEKAEGKPIVNEANERYASSKAYVHGKYDKPGVSYHNVDMNAALSYPNNTKEDQKTVDRILADETRLSDFERDNALDHFQANIAIHPQGLEGYSIISQNAGLLRAKKQLHIEASRVLFSQNTFVVLLVPFLRDVFWRCGHICEPADFPCLVDYRHCIHLKHIYLEIRTETPYEEPKYMEEINIAHENLKDVVRVMRHIDIKLKTLKVRYSSHFQGQLECLLRGPKQAIPGQPDRRIIVDKYDNHYTIQIDHDDTIAIAKGGHNRNVDG